MIPLALWMALAGHWNFEKISKNNRVAEPVVIGMPFPRGALTDPRQFRLAGFPVQSAVTARWPDGSARWLLVRALVDLPGNRSRQLGWTIGDAVPPPRTALRVRRGADGSVEVETGPLAARVPASGFFPLTGVRLNGQPFSSGELTRGFRIDSWASADAGPVKIEVLEEGPVSAVIGVSGRHGPEGSPFDFNATLTFWSGKSYVWVDYTVLAAGAAKDTPVNLWEWRASPGTPGLARLSYGHYTSSLREARGPLAYSFGVEQFRYNSVEHAFQSFWGDFWCDWTGNDAGLAVTLRQAQQNFPKAMEARPDGLTLSLYPAGKEPLIFAPGVAKTHSLMLHFHPASEPAANLSERSLQFQIPDLPSFDPAWWRQAGVWADRVLGGTRSRRIDAALYDVLDNRPVGMGIWNFGDEVEWGYTAQGRGRDEVVWLNNEYDFTHHCFLAWARSGERRFLDYGRVNARHWHDVDIARTPSDPARHQGHISHSQRHVTGGISPSHQWVEGLFDAWHLFGDRAARQAALGIGENILRALPRYTRPGASSTRDTGWALRALMALYRETGDERYLAPCRDIAALFKQWHRDYPGLLSPYTDHSQVRVVFMNSLTLVSLARFHLMFPDEELKRVILEETDDMIRNTRNGNGLFFYKELPSLKHQGSTLLILQALGYAYLLSGDKRYIEAGLPELEYLLNSGGLRTMLHTGAAEKFAGGYSKPMVYTQGGKFLGVGIMPLIEFLTLADSPELMRQIDWQLRLP